MSSEIHDNLDNCLSTVAVAENDFKELLELRIAAMRESLERLGRFDPERAHARLRQSFYPAETQFIVRAGQRIGFYTFRRADDGFYLDHLYIHPRVQTQGIGSTVLRQLLAQADALQLPIRLNALRESAANQFYQRHGFVQTAAEEWDISYVRWPLSQRDAEASVKSCPGS